MLFVVFHQLIRILVFLHQSLWRTLSAWAIYRVFKTDIFSKRYRRKQCCLYQYFVCRFIICTAYCILLCRKCFLLIDFILYKECFYLMYTSSSFLCHFSCTCWYCPAAYKQVFVWQFDIRTDFLFVVSLWKKYQDTYRVSPFSLKILKYVFLFHIAKPWLKLCKLTKIYLKNI